MRKKQLPETAVASFGQGRLPAIKLVSDSGNVAYAHIFFKVTGLSQDELDHPFYKLAGNRMGSLQTALLEMMVAEGFHNFYPDLLKEDPTAGAYAGTILRRNLVANIKAMKPDLQSRAMSVETVILSFAVPTPSPVPAGADVTASVNN